MRFKESRYIPNSEVKRLAFTLADTMSKNVDKMADEVGLNYLIDDQVQRMLKLIGLCKHGQCQDDNNKPRRIIG